MTNFTPVTSLLGGALIGLAAAWTWLTVGRIAGISGIVGGATRAEIDWRIPFVVGLVAAPMLLAGAGWSIEWHVPPIGWGWLIFGGILVGFGTRLGAGCTSGHGVCGIALLSPRSIAATMVFMLVAAATVYAQRHLGGL
jgi:uncharacterized membrane protein YedE/YeeE